MSEFKFACPGCGQRIAASDEYVGFQITCPICQASITVPAAPPAATIPGGLAAPVPPKQATLSVAALSSPQAHGPAPAPAHVAITDHSTASLKAFNERKAKKSYNGLIGGAVALVVCSVAAYFLVPIAMTKWKESHGALTTEEQAATNAVNVALEAEKKLTAEDIWQKVAGVYQGLSNLRIQGKVVTIAELGQANAAMPGMPSAFTNTTDLTIKFGRPDHFRVDSDTHVLTSEIKQIIWSTEKGSFFMANDKPTRLSSRDVAVASLESSAPGSGLILHSFWDASGASMADSGTDWSRGKDENLNGTPCFVLAGTVTYQKFIPAKMQIWVNKTGFLIPQVQIKVQGEDIVAAMTDDKLKETLAAAKGGTAPSLLEIANAKAMVKKLATSNPTVTETYQTMDTNSMIALEEFQPALPAPTGRGRGQPGMLPGNGRASNLADPATGNGRPRRPGG